MAEGKVVQIIGTVVDVEFPPEELPAIYNGVEIEKDGGNSPRRESRGAGAR
ncbi:MAG TPA: hypothetical protein VJM69_07140 [Dehalococcoidia bacterium]|nr:hypothetical protein [Dehalococcoidia bacterium]